MNLLIKPLKIRTRRYQKRCILNVFLGKIGEPAKQWNAMSGYMEGVIRFAASELGVTFYDLPEG